MVKKDVPQISEIHASKLNRIRKILWQRAYRSRLVPFLEHNMLKANTGLELSKEFEEEQYEYDEN